jgi:cytochrome P450
MSEGARPIPDHVPHDRVRSFDIVGDPDMARCPFARATRLHDEAPRMFWNTADPYFGGAWVPTRAEDIRFILDHPEIFTSKGQTQFAKFAGQNWDIIPLEIDPPEHGKYRRMLNPLFSPPAVELLAPRIVARATELIDRLVDVGECEFMTAFGRPFPVSVFLELMGLPDDQTDTFMAWEHDLLHNYDMTRRGAAIAEVGDYLLALASERRARPTGDLTSFVVAARVDGRLLTDDEVLGTLFVLFMGGLDTVLSTLGLFFLHLAEHPDQQALLRAAPERIDRAVDELMRRYSPVSVNRQCARDIEIGGARLKAGDWVSVTQSLGSLDPEAFEQPYEVHFDRRNNRHFGFSFGPHFCLGSHLARRELGVALREWLARVPMWRVKPGTEPLLRGGGVFGVERLELEWRQGNPGDPPGFAR